MKVLETKAKIDYLSEIQEFIEGQLQQADCPVKIQRQIAIAVEEIFVNIANYAYPEDEGWATIKTRILSHPSAIEITFADGGIPYNPLSKEDPDITLSANKRPIGGLGIYMVKQTMDDVQYQYLNGQNVLTMKKGW